MIGLVGALHQHVADAVEQRGERKHQPMDREIAAIAEDLRGLPRLQSSRVRFGRGWLTFIKWLLPHGRRSRRLPRCLGQSGGSPVPETRSVRIGNPPDRRELDSLKL